MTLRLTLVLAAAACLPAAVISVSRSTPEKSMTGMAATGVPLVTPRTVPVVAQPESTPRPPAKPTPPPPKRERT